MRPIIRGSVVSAVLLTFLLAGCGAEDSEPASPAAAEDTAAADTTTPATKSSGAETSESKAPDAGAAVPAVLDFSGSTVAGDKFEGASLAGKPAVLWFWAPWCPTCRGQIEGVSALAGEYGDKVSFVGVGSLDEAPAIEDFAGDVPAAMPHLLDPEGAIWRHFGITEQSVYVVLDADSKVVSEGYLDDAGLKDLVAGLAS
jgi:thiol-disulfide isomerase/thioredoxin